MQNPVPNKAVAGLREVPDYQKLTTLQVLVTPEIATKLLENNTHNRKIRQHKVDHYARQMLDGHWRATGNTISIGPDGRLLNGQHHLWAVLMSQTSQHFIIICEESNEIYELFDTGLVRQASDILKAKHIKNGNQLKGIADKFLKYIKANNLDRTLNHPVIDLSSYVGTDAVGSQWNPKTPWQDRMSHQNETLRFIEENHNSLIDAVATAAQFRREFKKGYVWYGAVMYIVQNFSPNAHRWEEFHAGVVTGANLEIDDPRHALRNYIWRNDPPKGIWTQQMFVGVGLTAWNKWIKKESAKQLRFSKSSLPMPLVK